MSRHYKRKLILKTTSATGWKKAKDIYIYGKDISEKYRATKWGAKTRNLKFNITLDEFADIIRLPCFYCATTVYKRGLDRLDNNDGYYLSNVVSCCWTCNRMKSDMSLDDFWYHIRKIARILE